VLRYDGPAPSNRMKGIYENGNTPALELPARYFDGAYMHCRFDGDHCRAGRSATAVGTDAARLRPGTAARSTSARCRSTAEPQRRQSGTLQTASGIEADRATRLWELWYQQKFLDEDRLDMKIGQQSLDQEFMVSQNALFRQHDVRLADAAFGRHARRRPGLSALGARRARALSTDRLDHVLLGVFNGSPVAATTTAIRKSRIRRAPASRSTAAAGIAELQYAYPVARARMVYADGGAAGAHLSARRLVRHREAFADQRYDSTRPVARQSRKQWRSRRITAATTHLCRRRPDALALGRSGPQHQRGFVRVMGTPQQDRNLISFSANAGLTMHEPFRNRDDDTFGLGMGYAQVSSGVRGLDAMRHRGLYNPGAIRRAPQRNLCRSDLPVRGRPLVAAAAGRSICLQSRRRRRQSE
jgi:hypothetical protein